LTPDTGGGTVEGTAAGSSPGRERTMATQDDAVLVSEALATH
jgi:hypothetical protein